MFELLVFAVQQGAGRMHLGNVVADPSHGRLHRLAPARPLDLASRARHRPGVPALTPTAPDASGREAVTDAALERLMADAGIPGTAADFRDPLAGIDSAPEIGRASCRERVCKSV